MTWDHEFKRCLEKHWLIPMPEAVQLWDRELRAAVEDLSEAEESYARERYKWCTIQAYYAMFHGCRALLYRKGYREKSHYCLSIAMRHLFVRNGLIDEKLIDDMDDSRALREEADYRTVFSAESAAHNLRAARRLIQRAQEILSTPNIG